MTNAIYTGSNQKADAVVGLSPEERNPLLLPAAWGLCLYQQTKLLNVGSVSLPLAEAEDVESDQLPMRWQHSSCSCAIKLPAPTADQLQLNPAGSATGLSCTPIQTIAQSVGVVEYADCFSALSVLDMTLNNLMVRFQLCWSFGECRVLFHYHCSQVHSDPEW